MTLLMRDQENIEKGIEQGKEQGILGSISILRSMGCKEEVIKETIMRTYNLNKNTAEAYLNKL